MVSRKPFLFLTVSFLAVICGIGSAYGGWPAPSWADLPKLDYIHDASDTIWFYSKLEVGGFPPRYVVTYEKAEKQMVFHPVSSRDIPKHAPLAFEKPQPSQSGPHIESEAVTLEGASVSLPELTPEEKERLGAWSTFVQANRRYPASTYDLSNAFEGSYLEVDGVYYFGMKGGISEGVGQFGGLAVYHTADGRLDVLRSKYLVGCSVTGITRLGDELALSTLHSGIGVGPGYYWEDGEAHKVGLVLYNSNSGEWRHIPFGDLRVFIRESAVIDGWLWMTTNLGVSCYQPELDSSKHWKWELRLVEQ